MSALSASEPDMCSVDVSLRTDKAKQENEPLSISFISFTQVSSVVSSPINSTCNSNFYQPQRSRVGELIFCAPPRVFLQLLGEHPAAGSLRSYPELLANIETSLESRSGTPNDNAWVAHTVSRISDSMRPRQPFRSSSAVTNSAVTRRHISVGVVMMRRTEAWKMQARRILKQSGRPTITTTKSGIIGSVL